MRSLHCGRWLWDRAVVANSSEGLRDDIRVSMLYTTAATSGKGGGDGDVVEGKGCCSRQWATKRFGHLRRVVLTSLGRRTLHRPVSCDMVDDVTAAERREREYWMKVDEYCRVVRAEARADRSNLYFVCILAILGGFLSVVE